MPNFTIIDTFNEYLSFWKKTKNLSIDDQINSWETDYMSHWPDLLTKQQQNYQDDGLNWRKIAKKHVFPFLDERLPKMQLIHETLIKSLESIFHKALKVLNLDFDVIFVIYVGIGCGAGWATTFRGKRACLFGLENAAESGWSEIEVLKGLVAHELGHLILREWRDRKEMNTKDESPYWQLYDEGFAQRCEHLIMDKESWHQQQGEEWLKWCINKKSWLTQEFLRMVESGEPVNKFFGSWFNIDGYKQTGYYLGHELIKEWEKEKKLTEIALISIKEIPLMVEKTLYSWFTNGYHP